MKFSHLGNSKVSAGRVLEFMVRVTAGDTDQQPDLWFRLVRETAGDTDQQSDIWFRLVGETAD